MGSKWLKQIFKDICNIRLIEYEEPNYEEENYLMDFGSDVSSEFSENAGSLFCLFKYSFQCEDDDILSPDNSNASKRKLN